jgi:hypothetical protein
MEVCKPPHIIVSAARTFAIYSEQFFVIPARQIGVSESKGNTALLKALSLYLSSDFVKYQQILTSPQFGVQRALSTLQALKDLPVPFSPDSDLRSWVDLHTRLDKAATQDGADSTTLAGLVRELNELTNHTLRLDDRSTAIIHDFVHVRMCLLDGKTGTPAVRTPTVAELEAYAIRLKSELDSFLGEGSSERHIIRIVCSADFGMVQIDVKPNHIRGPEIQVSAANDQAANEMQTMQLLLRERRSQWIYFNRNLRIYEGTTTYIAKPMQRLHWLESQAMLDANEIIAETLEPAMSNEGNESSHAYGQVR